MNQTMVVTVNVTNNGEYVGRAYDGSGVHSSVSEEVVMVFASPRLRDLPSATQSIPQQQLVGFAKVKIAAGATAEVKVKVAVKLLRLVGSNGVYELCKGEYDLHIGGKSPRSQVGNGKGSGVGGGDAVVVGDPLHAVLVAE